MSSRATERELRQARKLSRTLGTIVFILGVVSFAAYFLIPGSGARAVGVEVALMAANVFFSASVVTVILTRATLEEANLTARSAIQQSIEDSLTSIRDTLLPGSQSEYRWHCVLGVPGADDSLPEYAVQVVTIEKTVSLATKELRFACIASFADDALAPYADDPRYQFRWVIDDTLDPFDRNVFDVLRVKVNGRDVTGRDVREGRKGAPATRIVAYPVPREFRDHSTLRLEYGVLVRKHVGQDRRILLRTQLFATTFGADFRCIVAPELGATGCWISSSEVSVLGPAPPTSGSVYTRSGFPSDLHIRYEAPLQSGSTVGFHLARDAESPSI